MDDDLEAFPGGLSSSGGGGARRARRVPHLLEPVDVLLDAFAIRLTDGYAAAAPTLTRALELLLDLELDSDEARRWLWLWALGPAA